MLWRVRSSRGKPLNAPAAFIHPCQPIVAKQPPTGPGWAHELKHDGYRLQIHVRDGRVKLYTMNGADWSKRYPLIVDAAAHIKGTAILDAEVVWVGSDGVADFDALHSRVNDKSASACAFDLLKVNGDDLRRRPYVERKAGCGSFCDTVAASSTLSTLSAMATDCLLPRASSGWRGLFPRSSTRPIARVRRRPGSKSKIQKRLPLHAQ
jgi:ATP-dependent DNA ligase